MPLERSRTPRKAGLDKRSPQSDREIRKLPDRGEVRDPKRPNTRVTCKESFIALGVVKRDLDRGYRKLLVKLTGKKPKKLTVGVHASEGKEDHGGPSLIQVATWNEYGTDTIPERSFIRAWFDENEAAAKQTLTRLLKQAAKGKITFQVAAERFGLWCVGQIQKRIAVGIEPSNAESTIQRKGSSKPLIDTGQLRSSIAYAIDGGPSESRALAARDKKERKAIKKKRAKGAKKIGKKLAKGTKRRRK